jgi:hypothetical protein
MRKIILLILCIISAASNSATIQEAIDLFQSKQYGKALPKLQEYANKGDLKAQSYLARIYINGLGTNKNFEEALFWASKAAAKNDPVSQGIMGYLYLNGYGGLVKDDLKALSYYRKAADQDNSVAIDRYSQIVLEGHTKKGLDEIENALIKDKSLSSSLVLMKLYGNSKYKPSNLYKSFPYALESIRRGASSPIWYIIDNSKYLQFTDVLNAAWLKMLLDLKNPDVEEFPNYQGDLKSAIESLRPEEIQEVKRIKLPELIVKTEKFVSEHHKKYGPIGASDLIDEGWIQFVGQRGEVNEPLAQLLMEEALKKSITTKQQELINHARNNLGVLFGAAVNSNVRNRRLAQVHIIDGADSKYGPDNLIWFAYEGKIELPNDQFKALLKRYKELEKEDHILESLGPLTANLKNKPDQIIQFLIKKYEKKANYQIAEQIADMYEDNHSDLTYLEEARKWYKIREKLQGFDSDLRLHRIEKILAGKYVKNMPDMRNSIDELFEVRMPTSPSLFAPSIIKQTQDKSGSHKPVLYALVIGNSNYRSRTLPNAANDSDVMAKKLNALGFKVVNLSNLSRKPFLTALLDFSQNAADSDLTVLFYSGHGMQMGGVNYLLPTDIDFNRPPDNIVSEGISLNDLLRRNLPGKNRVVFLDACRTNPTRVSGKINPPEGLAPINAPRSTLISFATRDGSVAYDSVGSKNSPYTAALVGNLDKEEDIAVLLRGVREEVLRLTKGKQEPWEYGSLTGGQLIFSKLGK